MNNRKARVQFVILEITGFLLTILIIWLDELVDLPHLLFNAPPTPIRIPEAWLETTLILIIGIGTVSGTLWLFRRIGQLESYIVMCAWCRKIKVEDERWITIEEYLWEKDDRRITHGLCTSCKEEQIKMVHSHFLK